MESIIDDINKFTGKNAELIIVNLSHDTQCNDDFRHYNKDEWHSLFHQLLKLNHLFVVADGSEKILLDLKLGDFIGAGHAAVVVVVEPSQSLDLGEFANQGFYLPARLDVFNRFSNTNDNVKMRDDQLQKLKDHRISPGNKDTLFLLSWTLTQQIPEGLTVEQLMPWLNKLKAIVVMAYSANKSLIGRLAATCG